MSGRRIPLQWQYVHSGALALRRKKGLFPGRRRVLLQFVYRPRVQVSNCSHYIVCWIAVRWRADVFVMMFKPPLSLQTSNFFNENLQQETKSFFRWCLNSFVAQVRGWEPMHSGTLEVRRFQRLRRWFGWGWLPSFWTGFSADARRFFLANFLAR